MTTLTNRDVEVTVFEAQPSAMRSTIVIPKGTRCTFVDDPMGGAWAVADVALLRRLTGNDHDPKYRYVFLPNEAVGDSAA
jgi:hypothetical protein